MRYKIALEHSDEGVAASVLGLPGCHSQERDEAEAIANVREAIREYEEVQRELTSEQQWDAAFAGSADVLRGLAAEAVARHKRGETEALDPDRL
ncbi:MAG: type II toxin-antitoxin system HicB family antitoxin [Lacipirellulaceae bacterium]